jgi:uncharacterized protein involved in tolerance to divalent cations
VTEFLLAFTTFANADDAARVIRVLVEERLIACGNLLPGAARSTAGRAPSRISPRWWS